MGRGQSLIRFGSQYSSLNAMPPPPVTCIVYDATSQAPEFFRDDEPADSSVDIYALGIMVREECQRFVRRGALVMTNNIT